MATATGLSGSSWYANTRTFATRRPRLVNTAFANTSCGFAPRRYSTVMLIVLGTASVSPCQSSLKIAVDSINAPSVPP